MQLVNTIVNHRTWTRHGAKIAWVFAALCLLLVASSIAWDVRQQSQIKARNYAPQSIPPLTKRNQQTYNVNSIVRANLFGDATPKPVVKVAPKTTLNLKLQGILWATDDTMARAIITSGKRKAELYSVGEKIKGAGASIKEIRGADVLLDRNGAVESLPLTKVSKGGGAIITYEAASEEFRDPMLESASLNTTKRNDRAAPKPVSPNGQPRKIRKPNFSGLDRALKKMGEI